MSKKIIALGEILLRLSAPGYKKLIHTNLLDVNYGGSEANVAVSLCHYGLDAAFVSKVPDNDIGQAAINHLRQYGVDTKFMLKHGEKMGIYFLETGASVRSSQIIYDRKNSVMSEATVDDFDFEKILDGADWFHTSSITPAISDNTAAITGAALKAAKKKGVTTSMDLNYRKKLWTKEKAKKVMEKLYPYVDICIGIDESSGSDKITSIHDSYKIAMKQMKDDFGFKYIASTVREHHSATHNEWSALVLDEKDFYETKKYLLTIVDRIGTGDAFSSGFIYGLLSGMKPSAAAEFGVAASALKHTIPGDTNHTTINEIQELIAGNISGKLQR